MAEGCVSTIVSTSVATVVPIQPEEVQNELQCAICFSVPLVPAMTPCDHVFCYGCLKKASST